MTVWLALALVVRGPVNFLSGLSVSEIEYNKDVVDAAMRILGQPRESKSVLVSARGRRR